MLKNIKLSNSIIILTGLIVLVIGISFGFLEYFNSKKSKAFDKMNIMLYKNETPKNITKKDKKPDVVNIEESKEIPQQIVYSGILEIPKINLKKGFFDVNSKNNNVDKNVTVIKGSTLPDIMNNNLILAAHSGVCSYCYFDKLYKLNIDDVAYISYNNIKYKYKIVNIYYVKKDGTVAIYRDYTKSVLTLITCTRNSQTKQTVYILELINKEDA